ncbi:DNA polymerase III subunit [Aureivirga marina]|uniref:DNA polymerase III subunit n=1 Tax=Aureivirga marina TaxID=1182451 RepID=UPI0018C8D9E7|nr:DNA polymerase III subunit delta' [Aureivirga marina]
MHFSEIIGQEHIKNHLLQTIENNRIAHAQLFVGKEGSGTLAMALAYAQMLLCKDSKDKNVCELKCEKLTHPDLHFAFPVATNDQVKKHAISNLFLNEWRNFLKENSYANLYDWYQYIGVDNKQGQLSVDEAEQIVKTLQLKSFEGGAKVMLIWMPEKMHVSAANKLLKLIEEPPKNTVFLLVSEDEEQIINTIRSRCQIIHFPPLSVNQIAETLISQKNVSNEEANSIAMQANGNYNKALKILSDNSKEIEFEQWFITWIRAAFRAKGNASVIQQLIEWSDTIAASGRETQKQFLNYCSQFFRQALLYNYGAKDLVFMKPKTSNFKLENFAPYIHSQNIHAISKELDDAIYHIERNGNAKIILLDLSIKLTRFLHQKEQ